MKREICVWKEAEEKRIVGQMQMCLRVNISAGIKVVLRPLTSVSTQACACDISSLMPAKGPGRERFRLRASCGEGKVFSSFIISHGPKARG